MTPANRGLVIGAAGIALMCGMDAVAKALGAELTAFQVVFVRYLGSAAWLALWIALTGGTWPHRANIGAQALRAIMLVATASMFFYAVSQLPLAVVAALGMTAPLYVTLIGTLLFREKMGGNAWLALVLGAGGAAVIIIGDGTLNVAGIDGQWLAWAAALLAPLTYASILALLKHHSTKEEPAAMTLGQSAIAALLVMPLAASPLPVVTPQVIGLVSLIGLLGAVGFLLLIHGLRLLPVSVFAVIDYTGLLWAALLGFVFFSELPGPMFWLGASLIIGACLCNGRRPSPAADRA
jgi:drug/metabolite transporter (DMT)-like permease